ncbi:MAG: hypothetical protein AB1458_08260 [Bacteroidota bacterium]
MKSGKAIALSMLAVMAFASVFAQRTGYRIRRYTAGVTYAHIISNISTSDFKLGYHASFAKCYPMLLYRVRRNNDKPLLYINAGLGLTGAGSKKNSSILEDTLLLQNYDASLLYLTFPLSFEVNFYQNRFRGFLVNPDNSFISLEGGIQFGYTLQSKLTNGAENRNFKTETAPLDMSWFGGIRLLQTLHGLSLDLKYFKGIRPVFNADPGSRHEYFMATLSWNRMESRCANSHRKMKRTIKVLNKIG